MELPRTRDVITLIKGQTSPVGLSTNLVSLGWPGGQGVLWVDSPDDVFLVDFSDGRPAGFLLWGSNETADQFISYTQNQPTYNFAVLCFGTWLISTSTFEKYTYQSRLVGPLVANTFTEGQPLYFSLRGLWTPQDEWALSGDPRAPNRFYTGMIVEPPSTSNNNFLTLQTTM